VKEELSQVYGKAEIQDLDIRRAWMCN